jgi:hypothetical protein
MFYHTYVPLMKWLAAIFLAITDKGSISDCA